MQRTYVYIDGFSFCYGWVKRIPYRWLNLFRFAQLVLQKNDVVRVKYLTAIVKATAADPTKHVRQQTFRHALFTILQIEVFRGSFQAHTATRPLANGKGPVQVLGMKEKGSDGNLATELLADAFTNAFEVAVIVSNDSDLASPVPAVSSRLKKPVGIIKLDQRTSAELRKCARFVKEVRTCALVQAQLPITDANGTIHKPVGA